MYKASQKARQARRAAREKARQAAGEEVLRRLRESPPPVPPLGRWIDSLGRRGLLVTPAAVLLLLGFAAFLGGASRQRWLAELLFSAQSRGILHIVLPAMPGLIFMLTGALGVLYMLAAGELRPPRPIGVIVRSSPDTALDRLFIHLDRRRRRAWYLWRWRSWRRAEAVMAAVLLVLLVLPWLFITPTGKVLLDLPALRRGSGEVLSLEAGGYEVKQIFRATAHLAIVPEGEAPLLISQEQHQQLLDAARWIRETGMEYPSVQVTYLRHTRGVVAVERRNAAAAPRLRVIASESSGLRRRSVPIRPVGQGACRAAGMG